MNGFYSEIASAILKIVCALIGILLTSIVVPWLKGNVIPWMKEKQIYGLVSKFVHAAEKLAEAGTINRADKKAYVIGLLRDKGYDITEEIEAFIESAVKELDITIDFGAGEIIDLFGDEDDPEADIDDAEESSEAEG